MDKKEERKVIATSPENLSKEEEESRAEELVRGLLELILKKKTA